jgi:ADP-ribosylglycohydrolase
MSYLGRLFDLNEFEAIPEAEIASSGYVVDSIEAAVWCLITTDTFKDCLLKAVNLADDTDTVAAIAGGIAGLYYGYEQVPKEWLSVIKRREWIEDMCKNMII